MSESRKLKKRIEEYRGLYAKDEYLVAAITEDTFGGKTWKSVGDDDRIRHIDIWWETPKGKTIGIDVKGIRKNDNGEYDDTFEWLEIQNNYGYRGWLYGEEEYIAFKTFTQIVYIKRCVLAKYVEDKLKEHGIEMQDITNHLVFDKPKDYFVPYQRRKWGRNDITIKVPTSDIIKMASENDSEGKHQGFFADYQEEDRIL